MTIYKHLEKNRKVEQNEYQRKQDQTVFFGTLIRLCREGFKLLKVMCVDNNENSIICFMNFGDLRKFIGYRLGAGQCIAQIVGNNEELIYMIHTP